MATFPHRTQRTVRVFDKALLGRQLTVQQDGVIGTDCGGLA